MKKVKYYLMELRAPFFTGTIVPIVVGAAMSWYHTGEFNWGLLIATLIGGIFLHAGANVSNDYYDHKSGNDDINKEFVSPFTGGSRMIPKGFLTPKEVLIEAIICYGIGSLIGLWLAYERGQAVLWIGLIGVVTSFFYTAPPIKFVYRGIGEIFIGLNFGVLMTLGSYFVQAGEISWKPVLVSIPIALLIMLILYINEFQDYKADMAASKNNWVVKVGRKNAAVGCIIFIAATYLSILTTIFAKAMPIWGLLSFLTLPLALRAIRVVGKNYDSPAILASANAATIQTHLFVGVLLTIGLLIPAAI